MCISLSNASFSTELFSILDTRKDKVNARSFRWELVAITTVFGPLFGSFPYILAGGFFALAAGFVIGAIPALLGGLTFAWLIDRTQKSSVGWWAAIGAGCGIVGCMVFGVIASLLMAFIGGMHLREEWWELLIFPAFLSLHGAVAGALIGGIESYSSGRTSK